MVHRTLAILLAGFFVNLSDAEASSPIENEIGVFTAVVGTVTVDHPSIARLQPVKLHDEVLFKDVIETSFKSRTKAFFIDDSVLTIGENSRVEVTEHIYNPDQNQRSMVVNLFSGKIRALVSKAFKGAGSKFEIHTPTAVAAARGTYFVVWTEQGTTGIVNIGESGRVDFTSGAATVSVAPGEYSVIGPDGLPTSPSVYQTDMNGGGAPASGVNVVPPPTTADGALLLPVEQGPGNVLRTTGEALSLTTGMVGNLVAPPLKGLMHVMQAIEGTVLKDMPRPETVNEVVRAVLPVYTMAPIDSPAMIGTTVGQTGTVIGKLVPDAPSSPGGSATPVASLTSTVGSALATVTSTVSNVLAPVNSVVSLVPVAPVTAIVSPVVAPVISAVPVLPPVTAIIPVAPVTPVTSVVPVTPPAVISGVTGLLGLN